MFIHYLRVALRNLIKHPLNSLIKILGLALGLAGALLVMIVNYSELTWDSFWPDAEQIYLVRGKQNFNKEQSFGDHIGEPYYAQLRASLSEKMWMTELNLNSTPVSWLDENQQPVVGANITTIQVSSDFIDIFQPHIIVGDLSEFAASPNVAFITQTTAKQLFGNQNPLGKILTIPVRQSFAQQVANEPAAPVMAKIIAVVDMDNSRSHIVSGLYFPKLEHPLSDSQQYMLYETYIKPKATMTDLELTAALNQAAENYLPQDPKERELSRTQYQLMPISARHMNDNSSSGNQQRVIILSLLGALILLVAVSNFINLSLAGYVARQKEVALRRIQGANKIQLLWQYWLDAGIYVLLACLLALIFCELFIPFLKSDLQIPLVQSLFVELPLVLAVVVILLVVSLALALYPAVYFSRVRAAHILRANRSSETPVSVYTRKFLLLVQFISVSGLLIGLASIHNQLRLIDSYQPGYKTKDIVMLLDRGGLLNSESKADVVAQQLQQLPGVIAGSRTLSVIPGEYPSNEEVSASINGQLVTVAAMRDWYVSADYFAAYGIPLLAGNRETLLAGMQLTPDGAVPPTQVVLCRTTALRLGFSSPADALGQTVKIFQRQGSVPGLETKVRAVIEDVHMGSHKIAPQPCMYFQLAGVTGLLMFAVSFDHAASEQEIAAIKKIWADVFGTPPHHWLLSGSLADKYKHERNLQWFMSLFALVTLVIGLLGIYGITSLSTQKRAREIALRKLHGASAWQIIGLINRDFARLVIIANLIAWPLAIYLVSGWLENFHQHFSPALWLPIFCSLALALCLLMVWLTATLHSFFQARLRPADALRNTD